MAIEEVRSFVAIELPEAVKLRLAEVQDQLKSRKSAAKWVAPQSIHLTLQFLGNITVSSIPDITRVISEAADAEVPFELSVRGLGVFPDPRRVRVVWVGLEGELDPLIGIQKRLSSGLQTLGFVPEARPFTPHLTLARIRDDASPNDREAVGRLVGATAFDAGSFTVESISLMKSQLTRQGAIYSRLADIPLAHPQSAS